MGERDDLAWLDEQPLAELHRVKSDLIRQGEELIDLGMINPDIPPPRLLLDKLLELAVRPTYHRYAVSRGVKRLREAFAQRYFDRFGVRVDPDTEICVTLGNKDGLEQLLRCVGARGRSVMVALPGYPHFFAAAKLAGLSCLTFPISNDAGEMLEHIARAPVGCVILLNFPHNPTGQLAPDKFFERLAPIAQERDLIIINDFVYGELLHDGGVAESVLAQPGLRGRAFELYSLSKAFSVPGWRVAAVLGDRTTVGRLSSLKAHIDYGIFLPLQMAAAAGLFAPQSTIEPIIVEYARRARTLTKALSQHGWEVMSPKAGCAVWAKPPPGNATSINSQDLALELLKQAHVVVNPGALFYPTTSPVCPWVRFALVAPDHALRMVVDRMSAMLQSSRHDVR